MYHFSQPTVVERMDVLEAFILFWFGSREAEYGEPEEELTRLALPGPLRRLYSLAGRWPQPNPEKAYRPSIFSNQDSLRSLAQVELIEEDRLLFLDENSGCWECATEANGNDPPVWIRRPGEGWERISHSLSEFLISFCLQETLFASRLSLSDDHLLEFFEANPALAEPLWVDQDFIFPHTHSFFLFDRKVLVGRLMEHWFFAANHAEGIEFLQVHQGPIFRLSISTALDWYLSINCDGGGAVGIANTSEHIELPPGTFNFDQVRDELLADASESITYGPHNSVAFFRSGQGSARAKELHSPEHLGLLFARAILVLGDKGAALEKRFKEGRSSN